MSPRAASVLELIGQNSVELKYSHAKPGNLVQTIERVSLILDMVGRSPRGMSIRDLSIGLKLPKGSIHRLLSSLSYFGFIRQDAETKNYFLGLKLMELGVLLRDQLDLRKLAEPTLRDLAETTGETAHMVILDMGEVVYIDKTEARQNTGSLKMVSTVGSRNPPHSCGVGKVLIAHFSEEELNALISEKGLPQRTANTITDPTKLKEHLKKEIPVTTLFQYPTIASLGKYLTEGASSRVNLQEVQDRALRQKQVLSRQLALKRGNKA